MSSENKKGKKGIKLDESTLEDVKTNIFNFEDIDDDEKQKDFYEFDINEANLDFQPIGSVGGSLFDSDSDFKKQNHKPKTRLAEMLDKKEREAFGNDFGKSKYDDDMDNLNIFKPSNKNRHSLEERVNQKVEQKVKDEIISIFEEEEPMFDESSSFVEPILEPKKEISAREEITIFEEDKTSNSDLNLDEAKIKSLMESAFYVYGHDGLSLTDLKKLTLAPTSIIKKILKNWIDELDRDNTRGISIKNFGEKYKFFTKGDNREELSRLITIKYRNPLSQKVMETLAIIAYNQPCTKAIIENIRGKDPTITIQKLIDLGLVIEAGRGDGPGRPLLFTVSHKFYDIFGIKNMSDLPVINLDQPFQDDDISFFDTTRFNE